VAAALCATAIIGLIALFQFAVRKEISVGLKGGSEKSSNLVGIFLRARFLLPPENILR
jgi:hypothetical protein